MLTRVPLWIGLLGATFAAPAHAVEADFFTNELYPVLEAAGCRQCHNDNGVASSTRLQFPPKNASPDLIAAFGLSLGALVDRSNSAESLLLRKPTARTSHGGGLRIPSSSEEEQALIQWVDFLAKREADPHSGIDRGPADTGPTGPLRRLTHNQYNRSVSALLGFETKPSDQFPSEDYVDGFANQAHGQSLSPILLEAYSKAAQKLAISAFRGADRSGLIPCKPASPTDAACRDAFLTQIGRRAYRRPMRPVELTAYRALFDHQAQAEDNFLAGARVSVEAMLQSPKFIFREVGFQQDEDAYRLAGRLAFFLWDEAPDESLLDAVERGKLNTAAGIEATVREMLEDPRAKPAMDEFLAQWLRFDLALRAVRDRRFYPQFDAELVDAMLQETRSLFRDLLWNDRDFMTLFTADYGFIDARLAAIYDLEAPPTRFSRVSYPVESLRRGILGQGTFLMLTSKPADTSPTERGKFVREHFLCQMAPPPPIGIDTSLPEVTDERPVTNRERLSIHLSNEACAGCHKLLDPIGLGLEQYDAIGAFREKQLVTIFPTRDEAAKKTKTKPTEYRLDIDVEGEVVGLKNGRFRNPMELGEILAAEPSCRKCVVKQLFRFAMGRQESFDDRLTIDEAMRRFEASGFKFRELIISIATSETFLRGSS